MRTKCSWPELLSFLLHEFSGLRGSLLSIKQVVTWGTRPYVMISLLIMIQSCEGVFFFQVSLVSKLLLLFLHWYHPFLRQSLLHCISRAYARISIELQVFGFMAMLPFSFSGQFLENKVFNSSSPSFLWDIPLFLLCFNASWISVSSGLHYFYLHVKVIQL